MYSTEATIISTKGTWTIYPEYDAPAIHISLLLRRVWGHDMVSKQKWIMGAVAAIC
jgi:hypothetical protein